MSPPLYIDTEVSHITWRGPCACMVKPYPCFRVSKDASASSITTRNPLFSSATAAAAPPMPAQNAQTQHTRDCRRWRLHYTHTHAHTHTHSVPGSTRFSVRKPPDQCLHRHGPTTLTNRAFASTRLRSVVIYAARKAVTASTDTYLHQHMYVCIYIYTYIGRLSRPAQTRTSTSEHNGTTRGHLGARLPQTSRQAAARLLALAPPPQALDDA